MQISERTRPTHVPAGRRAGVLSRQYPLAMGTPSEDHGSQCHWGSSVSSIARTLGVAQDEYRSHDNSSARSVLGMPLQHPVTPDGRYFVVKDRLWRLSDPSLSEDERAGLVSELMHARRAVREAKRVGDPAAETLAHSAVDVAKRALGERGPVWWTDGAADLNRHMVKNTLYAEWFKALKRRKVGSGH